MEAESNIGSGAVHDLQSVEQVELLDAIDRLRCENIDADIGIPQVVVCGDQSSGKSSLLEAIAQVPFPAGSGTCTLFPTELVLRNAEQYGIKISIEPSKERSLVQRQHLRAFRPEISGFGHDDFLELYEAASAYLREFEPERGFWYDRFRAEISGPDQPHLSCIDLPGLFLEASHKLNQRQEDVMKIRELTTEYINNPRTVVIAVVSATADFQTQIIGNLISNSGEAKSRTLGVITKPDRVTERDDARRKIAVARNEELELGLGWHVVKNLSHEHPDRSQRDSEEREFFRSSIWSELPSQNLGIATLRQKLSQNLLNCVKDELPVLISEMEKKLADTKKTLDQLGPARQSPKEHRIYLSQIANKLCGLVNVGMSGDDLDARSDGFFDSTEAKKLRNLITREGDDFASAMREKGKQFRIEDGQGANGNGVPELPTRLQPNFSPPYSLGSYSDGLSQWRIPFGRYCEDLAFWMQNNRGKDLRGLVKRDNIQAIFRQQSVYWEPLSRAHVQRCHSAALEFMRLATKHVAGPYTGQSLMESYVNPAFDAKYTELEAKISELLWPYQKCHLITDNPSWITQTSTPNALSNTNESTISGQIANSSFGTGLRWSDVAVRNGCSSDQVVAAQALDRAEVYYDIAINTLVDNIATLAIERCLLEDLPNIVASDDIAGLDDEQLATIGAEPTEAREERAIANAQCTALEDVIRTCRRHTSHAKQKPVLPVPEMQSPGLSNLFENLTVTEPVLDEPTTIPTTPSRRRNPKRKSLGTAGVRHGLITPEPSPGHRFESSSPSLATNSSRAQKADNFVPQSDGTTGLGRWGRYSRESSRHRPSFNPTVADASDSEL